MFRLVFVVLQRYEYVAEMDDQSWRCYDSRNRFGIYDGFRIAVDFEFVLVVVRGIRVEAASHDVHLQGLTLQLTLSELVEKANDKRSPENDS